ncbi:MAG: hypothetical protein PVJ09_00030 [Candidatus Woesebacteria bacterium]|jgi:hypothetical protein
MNNIQLILKMMKKSNYRRILLTISIFILSCYLLVGKTKFHKKLLLLPIPSQVQADSPYPSSTPFTIKSSFSTNSPLNLSISPPVAYIHVKPGENLKHEILLTNQSLFDIEVSMDIRDFKTDGISGQAILGDGSIFKDLITSNLGFGQTFKLKAKATRKININVMIADSAEQKEYPLSFLFTAKKLKFDNNYSSRISGVIASNLILLISPSSDNQGELVIDEIYYQRLVDSFSQIKFNILVKNQGKNATPINGRVKIYNLFNQQIKEYVLYPDMVLAGTSREARGFLLPDEMQTNADNLTETEKQSPLLEGFSHQSLFLFGIYTVTINLGQEVQVFKILAFPFSIILLIIIGTLVLVSYKILVRKMRIKD